jgi:hypothetical protein
LYDLSQGKLFLIRSAGGRTKVGQIDLDLSGISPTNQGIEAFGRQTPVVADFIVEQSALFQAAAYRTTENGCPDLFRVPEPPMVTTQPSDSVFQSLKGYDVYSYCWEGEWYFTLEPGLNSIRPCDRLIDSSIEGGQGYTVKGIEGLLAALQQFPAEEHISWCGYEGQQRMPDPSLTAAATTPDGSLWYAFDQFDEAGGSPPDSLTEGLFRLKDGRVTHYDIPATIRVLKSAPDGNLYLGAGCGIMVFRGEEWETLLDLDCSRRTSVSSLFPIDMDFANDGLMWVGGAYSLASYDGQTWTEYDIPAVRVVIAPDDSVCTRGWDGRAGSNCCLTHLSSGRWMTYTWSADLPAEPEVIDSLLD